MATIVKTYRFEAAHQLYNHKGKCANLHGHSYQVDVAVGGSIQEDDANQTDFGFVLDFGDLDLHVDALIVTLDHTFLNSSMLVPRTTAEYIACWFVWKLYILDKLPIQYVDVHETENSFARASILDISNSAILRELWDLGSGPLVHDLRTMDVQRLLEGPGAHDLQSPAF